MKMLILLFLVFVDSGELSVDPLGVFGDLGVDLDAVGAAPCGAPGHDANLTKLLVGVKTAHWPATVTLVNKIQYSNLLNVSFDITHKNKTTHSLLIGLNR